VVKKTAMYSPQIESTMQLFYSGLSEKDQRHYAAQEAMKLGWGGKSYISNLFQISPRRVRQGAAELLNATVMSEIPANRQRRIGGGRRKKK
jgi:hypothetical protein